MAEIFDFTDYRAYLRASQRRHPATQRALTLEEWSDRLGYQSPRSIAMVIKGQRLPSRDLVEAFATDLKLNTARKRYFELLVLREKHAQQGDELDGIVQELESLNMKQIPKEVLDSARFAPISEWPYLVLREFAPSPKFQNDPEWISKRLRGKINAETAAKILKTLTDQGYLEQTKDGRFATPTKSKNLSTTFDDSIPYTRRHHAQMMQRAVEALNEQDVGSREFFALTLLFDQDKVPQAKQAVREFAQTFNKTYTSTTSDRVYQLNLQFFEHTKGE